MSTRHQRSQAIKGIEDPLAKRNPSSGNLFINVISVLLKGGHLARISCKALHCTCRSLRSLVCRHIEWLTLSERVDPQALDASGILGSNVDTVNIRFSEDGEERCLELVELFTARCSQHVRWLEVDHAEGLSSLDAYRCLSSVSWPMLRGITISAVCAAVRVDVLFPPGAASMYPKLETVHFLLSRGGLTSLDDAELPPQLNGFSVSIQPERFLHKLTAQPKPGYEPERFLQKLTALQSLSIYHFSHCRFLKDSPLGKLTELQLDNNYSTKPSETYLEPLFSRPWPQLQCLELDVSGVIFPAPPAGPAPADDLFPSLVSLALRYVTVDWKSFKGMKLPQLRSLHFGYAVEEYLGTEEAMAVTLNNLPELRELELNFLVSEISGDILKELLLSRCLSQLTVLRMVNWRDVLENLCNMEAIAWRCQQLQVLRFQPHRSNGPLNSAALHMLLGCGAAGALPLLKEVAIPDADSWRHAFQKVWPGLVRIGAK